jgi:hypothetical protein
VIHPSNPKQLCQRLPVAVHLAADGGLYCAWGDGGGFGGDDHVGVAVNAVLNALGGVCTPENSPDPVHASGRGAQNSIAWSADFAKSRQIAAPRSAYGPRARLAPATCDSATICLF